MVKLPDGRARLERREERRDRRGAVRIAQGLVCALIASLIVTVAVPVAANAAVRQSVASISPTVGSDRVVAFTITCGASSTCSGTATAKLSTGGSKQLSYRIAKKSSKTLTWTLGAADHRKFAAKGRATLTVTGRAAKPAKETFSKSATVTPATAQLKLLKASYDIADDREVPLALNCAAATGCTASARLLLGSTEVAQQTIRAKRGAVTVKLRLPATNYEQLAADGGRYSIRILESAPKRVETTRALSLRVAEKPAPQRGLSKAYVERNWTPTAYDTCPAKLHASYRVVGPDGKYYPSWHPAQVIDPATGRTCTFGHEHGADPASSEIFDWVSSFTAPKDVVPTEPTGLPFGYTSEELDNYVQHDHGDMSMRHEDNGGHKVFVANNVKMLDADRNWLRLGDGTQLTCDFLIKQHQGSWSPDAISNNAHEILFAARCDDGTELITSMLSRFGNANEMFSTCAPDSPVPTVGSTLPAGDGGKRIIPTTECVKRNPTDWSLYELWEGENSLVTADGAVLARFDPWFGVRNPSRLSDSRVSTATSNGISRPVDLAWLTEGAVTDYLWAGLAEQERFDYSDPRSPFNGARRDFYLGDLQVSDPGTKNGIVFTDPYGGSAGPERRVGSIAQLIKPGSVLGTVKLSRQKFDAKADFGKDNGVHAPN